MALSETDLHRIRLWARERVPEHLWDQVKVEADVSDRHVDGAEEFAAPSGFLDNVCSGPAVAVIGELPWR